MADLHIADQLVHRSQQGSGNITVIANPRRVALYVAAGAVDANVFVFAGPDANGVPISLFRDGAGNPAFLRISIHDIGDLIRGTIFVVNNNATLIGVTEVIWSAALADAVKKGTL